MHQLEAFQAQASRGKSLVLATGTASGKTESMALPILDRILKARDRAAAGAGVPPGTKALFVFPLNALATDQRDRLRKLVEPLDLEVGTMTGLTPSSEKNRLREKPPDILITNFTMLEYMLLRPADRNLIGPSLAFLALDEAHVYRGAVGRDMSLLLRRLRLQLEERGADPGALTVFLASATFGGSEDDTRRFAADLTGADAEDLEVIRPTYDLGGLRELPAEVRTLIEPLVKDLTRLVDRPHWTREAPPFREVMKQGPCAPGGLKWDLVRQAIDRWLKAKEVEKSLRAWQLKVHALAHGLGGLLVDLRPGGLQGRGFGRLRQEEHLEGAKLAGDRELEPVDEEGRPLFRLMACDRCGMPFLFGYVHGDADGSERLHPEPPPLSEGAPVRSLFLAWPELAEKFLEPPGDKRILDPQSRNLCPPIARGERLREFAVVQDNKDKLDTAWEASFLKECPACGARNPRRSVATDFVTDSEEATAAIAKELLGSQVEGIDLKKVEEKAVFDHLYSRPHAGASPPVPKLLSFSDTRREAARFAPITTDGQLRSWILTRMAKVLELRRRQPANDPVHPGLNLEGLILAICEGFEPYLLKFLEPVWQDRENPDPRKEVEFE
ncbi:MAG: DEAD/DEAH box helicase, partial [Thermoanaerobaculia bacterium]